MCRIHNCKLNVTVKGEGQGILPVSYTHLLPNGEITLTLIDSEPNGMLDAGSGVTKTGSIQLGEEVKINDIILEFTVINRCV